MCLNKGSESIYPFIMFYIIIIIIIATQQAFSI